MYQATLRVLCNTFCNILFFSQPFSLIDKCILICGVIFVNCYIVLSKLFAAYIFIQKKRLRKTDAKFHIMDSGTEYTEQSSMAIICPQSGSRLSHPPLLRFRRHLSKISLKIEIYNFYNKIKCYSSHFIYYFLTTSGIFPATNIAFEDIFPL